jgi:hypothetical protein
VPILHPISKITCARIAQQKQAEKVKMFLIGLPVLAAFNLV